MAGRVLRSSNGRFAGSTKGWMAGVRKGGGRLATIGGYKAPGVSVKYKPTGRIYVDSGTGNISHQMIKTRATISKSRNKVVRREVLWTARTPGGLSERPSIAGSKIVSANKGGLSSRQKARISVTRTSYGSTIGLPRSVKGPYSAASIKRRALKGKKLGSLYQG